MPPFSSRPLDLDGLGAGLEFWSPLDRLLGDRHRLQPFELIALNDLGNAAIRIEALRQCNPSKWPFSNSRG